MKNLNNKEVEIIKTQNHTIPELFENMRQAFLKNDSAVVGKFSITYRSAGVRVFELRAGKIFVFCDRVSIRMKMNGHSHHRERFSKV